MWMNILLLIKAVIWWGGISVFVSDALPDAPLQFKPRSLFTSERPVSRCMVIGHLHEGVKQAQCALL